jgi:hypothetical protein
MSTTNSTDQYIAEYRRIHERLREIAWRTDRMARENCANYANPNFTRAFNEQIELLQRLSNLDNQL